MPTTARIFAALALVFIAGIVALSFARAEDEAAAHDPDRGAWFKSLKTPQGGSCCDLSDCRQTQAKQNADGSWVAIVNGKWRDIPPEKVLASPLSIDGEAYVCNSPATPGGWGPNYGGAPMFIEPSEGTIFCFVPPIPGF